MKTRSVILDAARRAHGLKIEGRTKVLEGLEQASLCIFFYLPIDFIVFVATGNSMLHYFKLQKTKVVPCIAATKNSNEPMGEHTYQFA